MERSLRFAFRLHDHRSQPMRNGIRYLEQCSQRVACRLKSCEALCPKEIRVLSTKIELYSPSTSRLGAAGRRGLGRGTKEALLTTVLLPEW